MKPDCSIISFPVHRIASINRTDAQSVAPEKHSAGIYDLINEQSDLLLEAMRTLVEIMRHRGAANREKLKSIWKRSDTLREYHLGMLACVPLNATQFNEISRISVIMDVVISHTRELTREVLELSIPVDGYMIKLATHNLVYIRTLSQALYKLATSPLQIEEDIRAALYQKYHIEKRYQQALASAKNVENGADDGRFDGDYLAKTAELRNIMERTRIYHMLYKSGKQLGWITKLIKEITNRASNLK